jgi:hypothetical protein
VSQAVQGNIEEDGDHGAVSAHRKGRRFALPHQVNDDAADGTTQVVPRELGRKGVSKPGHDLTTHTHLRVDHGHFPGPPLVWAERPLDAGRADINAQGLAGACGPRRAGRCGHFDGAGFCHLMLAAQPPAVFQLLQGQSRPVFGARLRRFAPETDPAFPAKPDTGAQFPASANPGLEKQVQKRLSGW